MGEDCDMKKKLLGFTLIELLIVISIMGILMTASFASYIGTQKNNRDRKRKADLEIIRQALEVYKSQNGQYPNEIGSDTSRGTYAPCTGAMTWVTGCTGSIWEASAGVAYNLRTGQILTTMPTDPLNDATHYYYYEPTCNQIQSIPAPCGFEQDCTNKGCCGYEIGAFLEGTGSWYKVCNP